MGIIYKIQNFENNKVYIGQTVQSLQGRITDHIYASRKKSEIGTLHYDINLYGIENFSIEIIEKCSNDKLSERETYWISKYDSFNNGYNNTRGGAVSPSKYFDIDKIVALGKEGKTLTEIAAMMGCSLSFVRSKLDAAGIKYHKGTGGNPLKVVMYSSEWKPLKLWNSISQAYRELPNTTVSESSFQHNVRIACGTLDELYGYHWVLLDDLVIYIEGRMYICRTPFDRDNIENGMDYTIDKNVVYTKIANDISNKVARCRFCGDQVESGENICKECLNQHPRCYENKYKRVYGKYSHDAADHKRTTKADPLPSKEVLESEIKTMSYEAIARKYGVYTKTLRDKLKEYGIYEPRLNSTDYRLLAEKILAGKSISEVCNECNVSKWKVQQAIAEYSIPSWVYNNETPVIATSMITGVSELFLSLTEAMEHLEGSSGTASSRNSVRWKIGNAAKSNKVYRGYTWKLADKQSLIDSIRDSILG